MAKAGDRSSGKGVASELNRAFAALARQLDELSFGAPAAYVYDPLTYAAAVHRLYIERYARRGVPTLLVGMNPGPWGMMQTGVPFGDVAIVRDWLGLRAKVMAPLKPHPKKPVLGFDSTRGEVSGQRLWGWAKERYGTPAAFFQRFFVLNYCPLAFLGETGANVTPDKLSAADRARLLPACDAALAQAVRSLAPERVIGVGRFARDSVSRALPGFAGSIGEVLHPSPASPAANRGWAAAAERQLRAQGAIE